VFLSLEEKKEKRAPKKKGKRGCPARQPLEKGGSSGGGRGEEGKGGAFRLFHLSPKGGEKPVHFRRKKKKESDEGKKRKINYGASKF